MRRSYIDSADGLLRTVWEAWDVSTAPRTQRLGAFKTWGANLHCESPYCPGKPYPEVDANGRPENDMIGNPILRCSRCQKLWPATPMEMGRNEIGHRKPNRIIGDEADSMRDLIDLGVWIIDRVWRDHPAAACAWIVHIVAPGRMREKSVAPSLGVAKQDIPGILYDAERTGLIDLHGESLTEYRVKKWISWARRHAMELAERRGVLRAA